MPRNKNPQNDNKEKIYQGIGVSNGIEHAKIIIKKDLFQKPRKHNITATQVDIEIEKLNIAIEKTKTQISNLKNKISGADKQQNASIFDAHILILEDDTVYKEIISNIKEFRNNAVYVYYKVMSSYTKSLEKLNDVYLRDRAFDIKDVMKRVLKNFRDNNTQTLSELKLDTPHILVAHELTPSDTINISINNFSAFVTEVGGYTSHTAILARSLNIPAVIGVEDITNKLNTGDSVLIDGFKGLIIANPSDQSLKKYEEYHHRNIKTKEKINKIRNKKTITKDNKTITLSGNIEFKNEAQQIKKLGGDGVGLYRTEFHFIDKALPSEEKQFKIYSEVVKKTTPSQVIFRTLDIGGDKILDSSIKEHDTNPFLGYRGIRFCLDSDDIFKPQLRAIIRSGQFGKIGIMFPLISNYEEAQAVVNKFNECKQELKEEGIPYGKEIELGIMIEIPSAVFIADHLAKIVDFFSIGTNDLTQYALAADRTNELVAKNYQSTHPGVLKLIQKTINAAQKNNIWTGVCGESAGDIYIVPLLIGLGINELSVAVGQLTIIKYLITKIEYKKCQELVNQALELPTAKDILSKCQKFAQKNYPELIYE